MQHNAYVNLLAGMFAFTINIVLYSNKRWKGRGLLIIILSSRGRGLHYYTSHASHVCAQVGASWSQGMAADTPSRSDSTDSKPLKVTRIYTGSDGETHFGSFTIQMKGSGTRVAATQLHFTCYNIRA